MSKKALKPAKAALEPTDTERLDRLARSDGFLVGLADGQPSYRIIARGTWHPTLREAIDELFSITTSGRSK